MKVISHPNGFLRITFSNEADGSQDRLHVWDVSGYEDGDTSTSTGQTSPPRSSRV